MNTENVKIFSKTLGGEVELATFNGNVMHNSLKALATEMGIKLEYKVIANNTNPTNHLIQCTATLGDIVTTQFGESNDYNLDTEIAKKYPALTAIKRAHDRAIIAALQFDTVVYSVEEMPNGVAGTLQATSTPETKKEKTEEKAKKEKKESKPKKEVEVPIAETPVAEAPTVETPTKVVVAEMPGLEPETTLGGTIIPFGNFKGKTFDEVYAKGGNVWFDWLINKHKPTSIEEEETAKLCKEYIAEKERGVASVEAPTVEAEVPVEAPTVEETAETSVETPVSETPVEAPTEKPTVEAEAPVEAPTVEETVETSAEAPTEAPTAEAPKMSLEELENVVLDIGIAKGKGCTMKQIAAQSNGIKWMNFITTANKEFTEEEKEQISLIKDYLSYVS